MTDRPRHIHEDAQNGRPRRRYRRRMPGGGWFVRALPPRGSVTSPAVLIAWAAAHREFEDATRDRRGPGRGSVAAFVHAYRHGADWAALRPNTRASRGGALRRLCAAPWGRTTVGAMPLAEMEPKHLRRIVAAQTSSARRLTVQALRAVCRWAIERGDLTTDPTAGVQVRVRSDGFHTWTADDIARFRAAHPAGTQARLAMDLAIATGAGRAELCRLGRGNVADGLLTYRREKTGELAAVPMTDALRAVMRAAPVGPPTFLVTAHGKPFGRPETFGNAWRRWCAAAGLPPRYGVHGLRKAFAVAHFEAGRSPHQIAAMLGHAGLSEVRTYTRDADRRAMIKAMKV